MGFRCMNKKCGTVFYGTAKYFKWKDSSKMVKQNVCKPCWEKARSLKVPVKD